MSATELETLHVLLHDLRNQLTVALLQSELLQDTADSKALKEQVIQLHEVLLNMKSLVEK